MIQNQNRKEDLNRMLMKVSKLCRDKTVRIRKKPFEILITDIGYSIEINNETVYINDMCSTNVNEILYLLVQKINYITDKIIEDCFKEDDEDFSRRLIQNHILFD